MSWSAIAPCDHAPLIVLSSAVFWDGDHATEGPAALVPVLGGCYSSHVLRGVGELAGR